MTPPAVILVRPQEEGNVGAAARAMANMGLDRLILVEPAALGGVARGFGVGGWSILDRAVRAASFEEAIELFGRVVGTTSRRDRPLRRHRVIAPRQLPEILAGDGAGTETALVFGSEDNGLGRRELERCSPVVAVPCAAEHQTLNLAQAVLTLGYELRIASLGGGTAAGDPGAGEPLASAGEVAALEEQAAEVLLRIGYGHQPIRAGLLRDLCRLVSHAGPTGREVRILRRLCNRAMSALEARPKSPAEG